MKRFLNHLLFWILYIGFTVGIYQVAEPSFTMHLSYEMASLPAKLLLVYSTIYFVLPVFLKRRKYWQSTTLFAAMSLASVFLLHVSVSILVYPYFFPDVTTSIIPSNWSKLVSPLLDLIIVSSLAVVIKLLKDRELTERRRLELEKLNARNELSLLKSQLHPHFLFNTLNGVYAQTLEDPKTAAEMVVQLSDLMRYIIYQGNSAKVRLEDEIECLRNYVELEKIRHGDRLECTFQTNGILQHHQIQPLLLIPFMENAFKHGVANSYDTASIDCKIDVVEGQLDFRLENSIHDGNIKEEVEEGIGLPNVKQRLNYLFMNSYKLDINPGEKTFTVHLIIPLEES